MTRSVSYIALFLASAFLVGCSDAPKTSTGSTPKKDIGLAPGAAGAPGPGASTASHPKNDIGSLDGEWDIISVTKEGGPEVKGLSPLKALIAGSKWTMKVGDRENKSTIRLDATVTPATIDMTRDADGEAAIPGKGIWKLEGDTLAVCFAIGEGARPKDFQPAQDNVVMVLTRAKK